MAAGTTIPIGSKTTYLMTGMVIVLALDFQEMFSLCQLNTDKIDQVLIIILTMQDIFRTPLAINVQAPFLSFQVYCGLAKYYVFPKFQIVMRIQSMAKIQFALKYQID